MPIIEMKYLSFFSRYIHRNPIEVKRPTIQILSDYPWSGYPAYVGKGKAAKWLASGKTYAMLGHRHRYKGYADYVGLGVDEDIKRFYSKGNIVSVPGGKEFRVERKEENETLDLDRLRSALEDKPELSEVLASGLIYPIERLLSMRAIDTAARIIIVLRRILVYPIEYVKSGTEKILDGRWAKEIKRLERSLFIVK